MVLSFFLFILPIIAVFTAIVYAPYFLYSNRRLGKQPLSFHLPKYALIGYLISLIFLTVLWQLPGTQLPPKYYFLNLRPFIWLTEVYEMGVKKMAAQLLLNIGMFVPFGLLLPMAVKRTQKLWKVASIILSSTVLIETVQYFLGRSADIDDVIMNFTGGILGYFLFTMLKKTRS